MCAIYGFLNYGRKVKNRVLKNIIRELSIAAECRGTDATGISYVNNGEIVTFKQSKAAYKMKLFFPKDTVAVIGHNRLTTQGSEKKNCNNHPFEGKTPQHGFALAHNGVLYNDKEISGAILKKWTAKSERWYNNKKRRETHGKHQVYRGIQAKHSKLV